MKKLRAFTLLELLIGMIISSIVIGFGYAGYTLIYERYLNYNQTKKGIIDVIQLNSVLNNDFINAESAQFGTDKLILYYETAPRKEYDFKEKYILRKDGEQTDTFKLEAATIIAGSGTGGEQIELLVTELSFDAVIHQEKMHFHFVKNYSAETLINLELNQWAQ